MASGVAPTAGGSRGYGLGARCLPSPTRRPSGVRGLAWEQGGGAVPQVHGREEHGVDGLQAPLAPLQVRDDPHLVVVAILQHDHGDGAAVTFAQWGCRAHRLRVACRQAREVVPPATGAPAFPCRQAFVRRDTEVVGPRWRGGPLLAPGAGRGPGVCRRRYEGVYPAQVWDPHAPLGWLVGVEPPDPRFNKVVGDLCPGGDERLQLPHKDFGCWGVWQGDHGEEPVEVDVKEVFPEGCHQLARGRGSVDAVERPQFRVVEGTRAPLLRRSGGWGGHGHPVLVQRCASRGGVP